MRQAFSILLIFLYLSCTNGKKNDIPSSDLKNKEKQIKTKIKLQPIFLNLSPKMNSEEFINTLTDNSNLTNGKFILPINKKKIEFSIDKTSDKIILEYDNLKNISVDKLNKSISEGYLSEQNKTITEFIEIFKLKYGNPLYRFEYKKLRNYGYDKQDYLVFQDSLKSVLIGYENLGTIVMSNDELREEVIAEGKKPKLEEAIKDSKEKKYSNELQRLADLAENTNTGAAEREYSNRLFNLQPKTFGIKLEINYLYNSDFEKLINNIENDKFELQKAEKRRDSIRSLEQQTIEKNKIKI